MSSKKLERPLYINMPADEALARFIATNPAEVEPAPGQARKAARPRPKPKPDEPPAD